jgi:hypothetical protein
MTVQSERSARFGSRLRRARGLSLGALALMGAGSAAFGASAPPQGYAAAKAERIYVVDNRHEQVTVADGRGKVLYAGRLATLELTVAVHFPTAAADGSLVLEDQRGHTAWTAILPRHGTTTLRGDWSSDPNGHIYVVDGARTAQARPAAQTPITAVKPPTPASPPVVTRNGVLMIGPGDNLLLVETGAKSGGLESRDASALPVRPAASAPIHKPTSTLGPAKNHPKSRRKRLIMGGKPRLIAPSA